MWCYGCFRKRTRASSLVNQGLPSSSTSKVPEGRGRTVSSAPAARPRSHHIARAEDDEYFRCQSWKRSRTKAPEREGERFTAGRLKIFHSISAHLRRSMLRWTGTRHCELAQLCELLDLWHVHAVEADRADDFLIDEEIHPQHLVGACT